jgi:hypothetical protein
MKINLNKSIVDLSGKELEGSNLGQLVSQLLASSSSKENTIKMYYWAQKFYAGEELDLDPTDLSILKSFIEGNEQLTVLAKAQILEAIS